MTQKEFESTIIRFDQIEPARSSLYEMGLNLLKGGFEIEAYLLILATWNFANFRYILRSFNLDEFKNVIKSTAPIFKKLQNETLQTANLEKLKDDIRSIYARFKLLVGQTGASKILHFKHPRLFVMWDTAIRKRYKIPNVATPDLYLDFLKLMQREFSHIEWQRTDKTLAKAIDEYNFVLVH